MLSAIVCRIRNPDGSVPLVVAYDHHEKIWNPPIPLLFQRTIALETGAIPIAGIRVLVSDALARTGLTDVTGKPLDLAPHDFRRIFTTDAILNGMPRTSSVAASPSATAGAHTAPAAFTNTASFAVHSFAATLPSDNA